MKHLKLAIGSFLIVMVLGNCIHAQVKMIPLYIGSAEFTVEIADTVEKQMIGLMYRETIPDDFGMLFVNSEEGEHSMWMKNTLVHLDLIFLNKARQVVDMYINVPPCVKDPCVSYPSRVLAQYVLELRGNRARELNLKIGDTLYFTLK
ncbi:MAG: DUF192 domain-containing protein [Acidobacteria bacterium]|jgi:hypothetical protein|nr:DUF192 domain-containing protein [Acidobacteriota bacterium]